MRLAASRTFWTAGRSRPIRIAMIAITTNNSMSVNADRTFETERMIHPRRMNPGDDGTGWGGHTFPRRGPAVSGDRPAVLRDNHFGTSAKRLSDSSICRTNDQFSL